MQKITWMLRSSCGLGLTDQASGVVQKHGGAPLFIVLLATRVDVVSSLIFQSLFRESQQKKAPEKGPLCQVALLA